MIGLNIYPKSNNHNNNINIIKVLANLKNKKSYALYLHLEPKDLIFLSYLHIVFLLKNIPTNSLLFINISPSTFYLTL